MGRMGARVVAGARGNRALKLLDVAGNGFVVVFDGFLSGFGGLDRNLDPKKCKNDSKMSFFEARNGIFNTKSSLFINFIIKTPLKYHFK